VEGSEGVDEEEEEEEDIAMRRMPQQRWGGEGLEKQKGRLACDVSSPNPRHNLGLVEHWQSGCLPQPLIDLQLACRKGIGVWLCWMGQV